MTKLSDLADCISDQCQPDQSEKSVYVGLDHIDSGALWLNRNGNPSEVRSAKNLFRSGDILYGKLRPYLDKAILAASAGICSTDILVFRPKPCANAAYLAALIHSQAFLDYAISTTQGVNHPRTSWKSLSGFESEVPSLPEQEKIAAVLWKIQRAIATQDYLIAATRDLKASAMQQLFTHGLHGEPLKQTEIGPMPESWQLVRLGDVYTTQLGKMLSQKARVSDSPKPYLRNKNVQWGYLDLSDLLRMDFDDREVKKFKLDSGDLLVCEGGVIGRAAIWHGELNECYYQKALHRVRPKDGLAANEFLCYWLSFSFEQQNLYKIGGASSTIAHIPQVLLEGLRIPLPQISEQHAIANALAAIDCKLAHHQKKRAALNDLFQTLLHKLMTAALRVADLEIDAREVLAHTTQGEMP